MERVHLGEEDIDERLILKFILKRWGVESVYRI
jgi:hypothetical protein